MKFLFSLKKNKIKKLLCYPISAICTGIVHPTSPWVLRGIFDMVPSHCWSWHGQKHRTPQCRSEQFLYGLLWINVSWMPHKSSRIFLCPVQWKNIDITFHIFKWAIMRNILLQLFIFQMFTNRTVHPIMGQLQCELDEGIWTDLALLDQALSKVTKGDDVRVHIISQSLGHRQRVGDHSLALPWNTNQKRKNVKQMAP